MTPDKVDALVLDVEHDLGARLALVDAADAANKALRVALTSASTAVSGLRSDLLAIPEANVPPAPDVVTSGPNQTPGIPSSTLPRLALENLRYLRAWHLPIGGSGRGFGFGGGPVAYDANSNSYFIGNRPESNLIAIAEVAPPARPGDGAVGTFLQPFTEPSEGAILEAWHTVDGAGANQPLAGLTGLVVLEDGSLMGNALVYYDASSAPQLVTHFFRLRDLTDRGHVSPFFNVGLPQMSGYVAGYMCPIPREWQALLGGTFATGTFGSPIVSRGSHGPALFAFTPAVASMPATSLVYYPGDHETLGAWASPLANPVYGMASKADGVAFIDGTATVIFVGRHGYGAPRYGVGVSDVALDNTDRKNPDGSVDHLVYDPTSDGHGTHAWPYQYQIWAYDARDFVDVAAGRKKPWEITPYAVWPLALPTPEPSFAGIGGVAYRSTGSTSGILTVSQKLADTSGGREYSAYMHEIAVVW